MTTTLFHRLDNGLTIVGEAMPSKQAAAFNFLIPAGSATEPLGKDGLTNVLESASYRGAGNYNARELSDALDSLGLSRGGGAGTEFTTFGGATLGLYLPEALEIYADIILRPRFEDWEAERALAIQALQGLDDSPSSRTFYELRRRYFTSGHARSALGTLEGLESLTLEDLQSDHAARFKPQGAILALAGNFDWEQTIALVEKLFGDWRGSAPVLGATRTVDAPLWVHLPAEKAQQQIAIAYETIAPDDARNTDYRLAMAILSGGMGARLFTEVREKRGLVYSVSASANGHRGFGYTLAYAGTTPERAAETLEVTLGELRRMSEGVTQDEVERARIKTLTSLIMQEESSRARAGALARDWWILGRVRTIDEITDAINSVTPASIAAFYESCPVGEPSVVTLGAHELSQVVSSSVVSSSAND